MKHEGITYTYDTEKRMIGKSVPNVIDYDYYNNNKQQLVYREEKYYSVMFGMDFERISLMMELIDY